MSRMLWVVAAITVMALCWGTAFLGIGSVSVALAKESTNSNLSQLDPEYRFDYKPPSLMERTVKSTRPT